MTIILIILVYLVGAVLAYGRCYAGFYEIDENYPMLPPSIDRFAFIPALLSWLGFLVGLVIYVFNSERYFLKFSKKPLVEKFQIFLKENPEYARYYELYR